MKNHDNPFFRLELKEANHCNTLENHGFLRIFFNKLYIGVLLFIKIFRPLPPPAQSLEGSSVQKIVRGGYWTT